MGPCPKIDKNKCATAEAILGKRQLSNGDKGRLDVWKRGSVGNGNIGIWEAWAWAWKIRGNVQQPEAKRDCSIRKGQHQ